MARPDCQTIIGFVVVLAPSAYWMPTAVYYNFTSGSLVLGAGYYINGNGRGAPSRFCNKVLLSAVVRLGVVWCGVVW